MSSTAERENVRQEEDRIVVHRNEHGYSLEYRDPNPETRYLPREQSAWEAIKEMWRLGGKPASAFRIR